MEILKLRWLQYLLLFLNNNLTIPTSAHGGHEDETVSRKKLLVISLDGFRYDFLDIHKTATLSKLKTEGVHAKSLTSSYITKTFPNHHSIATGLYEENHGIVANHMWDPQWNTSFVLNCLGESCGRWYGGQPIWNTNELNNNIVKNSTHSDSNKSVHPRNRRHGDEHDTSSSKTPAFVSGVIYWPGSTAQINHMNVTFVEGYKKEGHPTYMSFRQRLDKVLSWFTHGTTPMNLGMVYYEYPDSYCHKFGPRSKEVGEVIQKIDDDLAYFLEQLKQHRIYDLNIVLLSDHGFADVSGYLYLDDCIDRSAYRLVSNTPIMSIWPISDEARKQLYHNLSNCEGMVVHKNDSAELKKYHYSNNRRISPIIVSTSFPEGGHSAKLIKQGHSENWTEAGDHGWNSTWANMHAFFIAHGPAFKKSYVRDSFENVNIYPMMCEVLGLVCPQTDGSLSVLSDILAVAESNALFTLNTVVMVSLVCALVAGIMIVGVCKLGYNRATSLNGSVNSRSYSLRVAGKKGFERTTLLETSDDEF